MIDFDAIFSDDNEDQSADDIRADRLKRDDHEIFANKRIHNVSAIITMDAKGRRDFNSATYRGTRKGPDGTFESIGLIFKGQRLDDLNTGPLFKEMEAQRQAEIARRDYKDPTRDVELTGAWVARSWKDSQGNPHKAFDLAVATWSYTNAAGEKVTQGAAPSVPTATKASERDAAVRAAAEEKAQSRTSPKTSDRSGIDR
jgi:hypothetical protein